MAYSEAETKVKLITPKLKESGWTESYIACKQRAENAEQSEFVKNHTNTTAQQLIRFILNRYESDGFTELADDKFSTLIKLSGLGTAKDVTVSFDGIPQLQKEYFELQREIYR